MFVGKGNDRQDVSDGPERQEYHRQNKPNCIQVNHSLILTLRMAPVLFHSSFKLRNILSMLICHDSEIVFINVDVHKCDIKVDLLMFINFNDFHKILPSSSSTRRF